MVVHVLSMFITHIVLFVNTISVFLICAGKAASFSKKTARCGDRALPFCRYLPRAGASTSSPTKHTGWSATTTWRRQSTHTQIYRIFEDWFAQPDAFRLGRAVFNALQKELVIVRPLDGYKLPRHVRISLGTRAENEKCLQALAKVLAG